MLKTDGIIRINGRDAIYFASYDVDVQKDSIDHEFGTKYEVWVELIRLKVLSIHYLSDDDCTEIPVTKEIFDIVAEDIERRMN